jgi:hypothetical protein
LASGISLLGQGKSSPAPSVASITSKASLLATWNRIDVEETPGRAKKLDHHLSSIDGSTAHILGSFKGEPFSLRWVESKEPGRSPQLLLTIGETNQFITEVNESWGLVWAGDLDGDGKLDLIIHKEDNNGNSSKGIYLSSRAKSGSLVGYDSSLDISEGC